MKRRLVTAALLCAVLVATIGAVLGFSAPHRHANADSAARSGSANVDRGIFGDGAAADALQIVASTPIVADIVRNVAPQAHVVNLVPAGTDPHSFSPTMSTMKDVAHADIAFTNGLLLEPEALTRTISTNLPHNAKLVELGEAAVPYGAHHIALVEDSSLSTIWLGFKADGSGADSGTVRISAVSVKGPGDLSAFTTGTFGNPTAWIASADGIDEHDSISLPANAHTHMSWGFSAPGRYELRIAASRESGEESSADESLDNLKNTAPQSLLGEATIVFDVGGSQQASGSDSPAAYTEGGETEGTETEKVETESARTVIDSGHMDISVHTDGTGITLDGSQSNGANASFNPSKALIYVPHSVATAVPEGDWRFLGKPGDQVWVLAQAVLGEHVHGEIDPHLWHSVNNAIAYVEVIREELSALDPDHASEYSQAAKEYTDKLAGLDSWMRAVLRSIPAQQRQIMTAHDSFGYLADAYGLKIAGFVAANPSLEPSVRTIANLTATIRDTGTQALFLEPGVRTHSQELINLSHTTGVQLCTIYSDTFGTDVNSYIELMEFNTRSLKSCLDPHALPAWPNSAEHPHILSSPST